MAGRPKLFNEKDAIRKATEVFWKKGYEASSTEELLKAMDIGKGSFYLQFKEGKKELYQRSLDLFSEDAMSRFLHNLSNSENEIEFLKNFILSATNKTEEQKQKGCYLGNGIVEMANIDSHTQEHVGALMKKLEEAFKNIITRAQKEGKITNRTDPGILAKYLINIRNGINVTLRTDTNTAAIKKVIELSLEILK